MSVMSELDIELQELDVEVDITNSEDVFDLIVDTRLANKPLSRMMLLYIASVVSDNLAMFGWLFANAEFIDCWDWHSANNGGN